MKKTPDWISNLRQCNKIPDGYYSVSQIVEMTNTSSWAMAKKLKKLVAAGEIKCVRVLVDGHATNYYGK